MIEADFIIVGTGAGGLVAALHAAEHGKVVMITKRGALDSNSNWAQGGIACVTAAVLLAVATRGFKWLWAPFLVFNVGVLVGTISEGGHNLADVFAGCLLAIVGLALAQALRRHGALTRARAALMARLSPWLPTIGAQAAETA